MTPEECEDLANCLDNPEQCKHHNEDVLTLVAARIRATQNHDVLVAMAKAVIYHTPSEHWTYRHRDLKKALAAEPKETD